MSDIRKRNKNSSKTKDEETKSLADSKYCNKESIIPKSQDRKLSLRVISRIVVAISLVTIVYFTSNQEKFKEFAKQADILSGKAQIIECSAEYKKELIHFEGCLPRECGRYVTDKVVSMREVEALLQIAKKGLQLGGSLGGASILDLHSGALSKGQFFIDIYKREEAKGLFTESDFNTYRVVKEKIKFAISHHFGVDPEKIYLTHPTFFSEISAKKAVTPHDEYWHPHVDKETYKSFHYTSLLYLSDYNIDFKGGRFIFIDDKYNSTVEPRKARVSIFTSGAENLHYVEKVTSGVRYAMTISFTCDIQYAIENPSSNKYSDKH